MLHAWRFIEDWCGEGPPLWRPAPAALAIALCVAASAVASLLWLRGSRIAGSVVRGQFAKGRGEALPCGPTADGKKCEDGPAGMQRLAVRDGRYVFASAAAPEEEEEDPTSLSSSEEEGEDEEARGLGPCAGCWTRAGPSRQRCAAPPSQKNLRSGRESGAHMPCHRRPHPTNPSSFESLAEVWEEGVLRLFHDEYVAEAGAVLRDLDALLAHGEARGHEEARLLAIRLRTSEHARASEVRQRALELEEAAECLRDSDRGAPGQQGAAAWTFGQRRFGVDTWYRLEADGTLSLKLDGHLDGVEIFYILACIREVDLFTAWAPFCHKSKLLRLNRRADLVAYMKLSPPFIARDIFMHAWAADHTREDGTILLTARSVDAFPGVETPLRGGIFCRRMNVRRFVACIQPITRSSLRNVIVCNVDVKAPLPAFVTNFVVRQMAGVLLYRLQRHAVRVARRAREGRECEHARRIADDEHGFYAFLRARIDALFAADTPEKEEDTTATTPGEG